MTQSDAFGDLLRRCRLTAGLTQEDLAEQAGLSAHTLSSLERGVRRVPHRETVKLLAEALKLDGAAWAALEQAARRARQPATQARPAGMATAVAAGQIPRLVGRDLELEAVRARLERALAGEGSLVLLAGEPGIGKTSLAEALAEEAIQCGVLALWGRCWESEGAPPFWPWVEILRDLVRRHEVAALPDKFGPGASLVAELVPELRERLPNLPLTPLLEGGEVRFRLFDAVTAAFQHVSHAQPLLLLLDDLHWADKPSLLLLQFLLQRLGTDRLLIVAAHRDTELENHRPLTELLPALRRERRFQSMPLRGLSVAAVGELAGSFLDQPRAGSGHALAHALWDRTEGNPLFVQEQLRYLVDNDRLGTPGGHPNFPSIEGFGLPERVRDVIRRRLARLSETTADLLTVAAVIGREFDTATLEHSRAMNEAALDEAELAHVLEEVPRTPGRYRFSHALFREVLYAELPARRRMRLHREIADALERRYAGNLDAHLSELAYHFGEGAHGGDADKALTYARCAGDRALASYAYEEAARHFEQALQMQELLDQDDKAERCYLLLALCEALLPAGEPLRVVETLAPQALLLADQRGDRQRAFHACCVALEGIGVHGAAAGTSQPEYLDWAERACRYAAPDSIEQAQASLWLAEAWATRRRYKEARALRLHALGLARRHGDRERSAEAAFWLIYASAPENWQERVQLAEEFGTLQSEGVTARSLGNLLFFCGLVFLGQGERTRAEAVWQQLDELGEQTHEPRPRLWALAREVILALVDGRLEESLALGRQFVALSDEVGAGVWGRLVLRPLLHQTLVYLGRPEEALAAFGDFARSAHFDPYAPLGQYAVAAATGLASVGRMEEARRIGVPLLEPLAQSPADDGRHMPELAHALELAELLEHRPAAAKLVARLACVAHVATDLFSGVCLARRLGSVSMMLGEREQALRYYEQALEVAGKIGFRPEVALTHLAIGELLMGAAGSKARHPHTPHPTPYSHLDFAIGELREMKMQPALERALQLRRGAGEIAISRPVRT